MKLASVLSVLEWIIKAAAFVLEIIGEICLIRRAVRFSKYAKEYDAFAKGQIRGSADGKVISRKALRNSGLVRNLFEITAVYRVDEKEYSLTELSVGRAYPLETLVEIEYNADYPGEARLKNGTDAVKYKNCVVRTIIEIVLLAVLLISSPTMINGIFVWIKFIIDFVYELVRGMSQNM